MRAHGALEVLELHHELVVHVQAARGVEQQEVEAARAGLLERTGRDVVRRGAVGRAPEAGVGGPRDALELVDGGGPVDVGGHEHGALAARLEPDRELARERGLTRALQTGEQHHGGHVRRARERDARLPEQTHQLLVHDPDHLLTRREAAQHLLAHRALLDAGHELLGHGDGHVGLEQCTAHVSQRLADVVRRQAALSAEVAEDALQPFGERFEHGDP